MGDQSVVTLEAVTKRYGSVTAVDRLSMSIAHGEMFGLIGPDGAGKTTTIRLICGLPRTPAGSRCSADPVRSIASGPTRSVLSQHFSLRRFDIDQNAAFFADHVCDHATARSVAGDDPARRFAAARGPSVWG